MSKSEKILFYLFVAIVQLSQFGLVTLIGYLNSRILEFLIMFATFTINRTLFGKSYHADKITKCTGITLVIFYFMIRGVFPINVSIFTSVLFGLYLAYTLNLVEEMVHHETVPKPFKKKLRNEIIDIMKDNHIKHDEELLTLFCIEHGLRKEIAETVWLYLDNSKDATADILDVDGRTVIRRVNKFIANFK